MLRRLDSSRPSSRSAPSSELRARFSFAASRANDRALASEPRWDLAELVGRFCELTATPSGAALTLAVRLVRDAQARGEPVVWVTTRTSQFHPPDLVSHGVDLAALAVVRVRELSGLARAADLVARSGAFGLVVIDLGSRGDVPIALQSRLLGAAQQHELAILCLTEKTPGSPSLGSLVSLRAEAELEHAGDGEFVCRLCVVKDKRRAPGWSASEVCRGPAGLR